MEFYNRTALLLFTNATMSTEAPLKKILSTAAASLSLFGSSTIFITYWMWPDLRTNSRRMIMFIAIGDFLLASTNIVRFWGAGLESCEMDIPRTIALLLTFIWTVLLSFFFYLTICRKISLESEKRFMRFFHVTAWGIPCVIALIAYFLKGAGMSHDLVTECGYWIMRVKTWLEVVLWMFITEEGWVILAYITITVFYVLVKLHIKRELSTRFTPGSPFITNKAADVARKVDYKLTFIPLVFVMVRIWGTIMFFCLLACVPDCWQTGHIPAIQWLAILNGIGDNIQGFTNFILFVLFTTKIRERLRSGCAQYLLGCCRCLKRDQPVVQRVRFYKSFDNF